MTRGGPDWFKGWEAFGTGVRLRVFPAYGGAIRATGTIVTPATEYKTLVSITGLGIIYGGFIWVDADTDHETDDVDLLIDDVTVCHLTFREAAKFNLDHPNAAPLWIAARDPFLFRYSMGISPGMTFDESVKVNYKNNSVVDSVTPRCDLFYAEAP